MGIESNVENSVEFSNRRNTAIVGHVDSGKTTLTEELTKQSLEGRVKTDFSPVELERGITIYSVPVTSTFSLDSKFYSLTIVDTPGHKEFGFQVETSLDCVEGAVLLVDMKTGFTDYTATLYKKLKEAELPVIVALNKSDLIIPVSSNVGKNEIDYQKIIESIMDGFSIFGAKLGFVQGAEGYNGISGPEASMIGTKYIHENIFGSEVYTNFRMSDLAELQGIREAGHIPTVFCSGRRQDGLIDLISCIFQYLPDPSNNRLLGRIKDHLENPEEDPEFFSGRIINQMPESDYSDGRIPFRIVSGSLKLKDRVSNTNTRESFKISHLYHLDGRRYLKGEAAKAGDIVLLGGLDKTGSESGHTLCQPGSDVLFELPVPKKNIVHTEIEVKDPRNAAVALKKINRWDPSCVYEPVSKGTGSEATNRFKIGSVGTFHLDALLTILKMEYGIEAEALSFMPDYVASHFKDCEDSAVGRYFSKDVSFEIKLKLSGSSNYDGLDLQNNYEVEKGVSRQILDTLEKTVEEHRFFGHFPLKGLCLEVVSAHSPTGKSNAHAKNTALNRALHKLLYQNNNMGLYEPWVNIEVKSKRDDVISELTMNLMSSPFLEKYPYEGYDHKQKCSVVNFELPFYWLIQGEEFITGILKHYAHDISVESYKAVPYGRAVKVIRDVCGFKENEESSVSNERRVEPIYGHRSIKAAFARELSQQELTMPIMAGVNSDISLVLGKDNSIYWNKNRPDCFGGARL